MKTKQIIKKANVLEKKRAEHVQELLETEDMIRGSFHKTYTKCGRKECRCFLGEGHLCQRITWTEKSIPRTKGVPVSQESWAKTMTETYKRFRENRKIIKIIENELNKTLDKLEAEIIKESWRKNKEFKL